MNAPENTNYGDEPVAPTDSLNYSDETPVGPQLSEPNLNARVARADFALGDQSPGHQVLKDAFTSGGEPQVRDAAAASADADFRQTKLATIQAATTKETPLTDTDVNTLMTVGKTPEANPKTVLEDKFGKNFVASAVGSDPFNNLVFGDAYNSPAAENIQRYSQAATNVISRHQIVKGAREEAEAAYADLPWISTNNPDQEDKLGAYAKNILTAGIGTMVNQRNLLNDKPGNSFLPGTNKLEQVQYLYLLPHDQVHDALMTAAGPGSKMWKDNPVDAMDFIRAAEQYSASDSYIDNVMGVANVASMLPVGTTLKGIGLMMGGKAIEHAGIQTAAAEAATAAGGAEGVARDVLAGSSKPPVGGSPMNANQMTAASNALDILGQSPKPAVKYYVPGAAVKRPWEAAPRVGEMKLGPDGKPSVTTADGAAVKLDTVPQEGHFPVNTSQEKVPDTYTTSKGSFEFSQTSEPVTKTSEHIVSAATKFDGKIYSGKTHADAFEKYRKETGKTETDAANNYGGDGFLTSSGRFVDRQQAQKIADAAEQVPQGERKTFAQNQLNSEAVTSNVKTTEGVQTSSIVNGKKTVYVDKKGYEKLSSVLDENKNQTLLSDDKGNMHVGDLDNAQPGKRVPGTTTKVRTEPAEGLYPIHLPEGNDKIGFDDFGSRITRVDRGAIDNKVTLGPQIVSKPEVEARVALADISKAATEVHPQDALSKMGQHEAAATVGAKEALNNKFDQVAQLGDVEAIRKNVPSLASPQRYYANSSSLSAERARRLADAAVQTSSELGSAILDPARVERMTQEALDRAIDNAKATVHAKYNRASDAILDQVTVWDSASNSYHVQTKFGKRDGTLFNNSASAKFAKDMDYKLGQAATVEQEGNKFYLSHVQHANETADGVRNSLIVAGNETPRGFFNTVLTAITGKINPLGNNIRSSAYTVAPFQRNNRIVATHSPSILRDAVEKAADDIEAMGGKWTTGERQELQRILEHNRDFMTPEGERGQFYKSALEFETAFHGMFQKMPTEKQIAAYDQFTRLSDLDWVLRELDWHRDKVRQGVRNYRINFSKADDLGIPQKANTEWFNAKKVENFDPVNTQNANIYVMPEGRFTTKFDLKKETVQDLLTNKGIKEGKYEILQVYNPGGKPLREATGIKDNIHFVVVDKYEDKALKFGDNSVYRPGGHVIYKDSQFMKQSQIGTGAGGRLTHFGDTTIKSFATPKEGQNWVDRYNTARELLHNNDEAGLKAYMDAGNLPETLPEFKKLFTDGGAGLSTEHPFVLTSTGRNTFQSSEELAAKYPGLKDTFSSYDLTQTQDSKFLAERDQQLNTIANVGTEANPIYNNVPSRLYDPYTALQKGMGQIVRQRWMGDYKISAAESWIQEFGLLFDQSKLPMEKLRQNPVYWVAHAEGNIDLGAARTNPELVAAAMTSRKNILNFIGARDEVGALMDGLERKLVGMTESIGGPKLAQFVEEKALPFITDAPAYARKAAFHSVIGMFNPVQLFQQAQGLTHILALSPLNGLNGATASALARLYRYTEDAGVLSSMADKAAVLGWNRDHFVEAYSAWKNSGTHAIGGEAALLNQVSDPAMFRNGWQTFLNKGTIFFNMGESIVRDTSFFTAYQDWRAANPTAVLNNRAMGDIGRRFDTLSLNMTRASNAAYNEGILSPATQFWTWNARFSEQMLGKQLTLGEKARAFTVYSAMYGVPATLGGVTFGTIPYANYNDIREYALAHNINVSDKFYKAFSDGLPPLIANSITGHETDFQRFSPNATQLKDILDGKKSGAEILGGASAGFAAQVAHTVWPAMMYGFSAFKKDSNFPLHLNDLTNIMENFSSFNNGEKAAIAYNTGQYVSKKEGLVDGNLDKFESVMLALGLNPKRDSDAYVKMGYVKDLKEAQKKIGTFMQEDWKIGMKAGMRGDFPTMIDYMKRVQSYSAAGNFTKAQEQDLFSQAARYNTDLVTGAERTFRENVQQLQSYPELKKYLDNRNAK